MEVKRIKMHKVLELKPSVESLLLRKDNKRRKRNVGQTS